MRFILSLCAAVVVVLIQHGQLIAQTTSARVAPWTTSEIHGTPDPPLPYKTSRVFADVKLTQPTEIVWCPAAQRWIATQVNGEVFSFSNAPDGASLQPLIDLNDLHDQPIQRAYGTILHHDPEHQPWCFVTYSSVNKDQQGTHLVRFRVSDPTIPAIDPASRVVLASWNSSGHAGSCMRFGLDGYLYVSVGDGQPPYPPDALNTGQDLSDLESSILRIDVDDPTEDQLYRIPADNPFVDRADARGEIWAFGFRNPWKMAFDPETGELFSSDVGWEMREMIYRVQPGANYGWSVMEGSQRVKPDQQPTKPITPPIFEHTHIDSRSVTGGYFWQSDRLPELVGSYIYGDWMTGKVWALRTEGDRVVSHQELVDTPLQIICFMLDPQGEVLIVGYDGTIARLERNDQVAEQAPFPNLLSQTGLFVNTPAEQPQAGVTEYEINAHHWADGTYSRQWIAVPDSQQLELYAESSWELGTNQGRFVFPHDSVLAKTVYYRAPAEPSPVERRLETQVLHRYFDEWKAYNYVWNEEQTDAVLQADTSAEREIERVDLDAATGSRRQTWHHASRSECLLCHIWSAGTIHGFAPDQLNIDWPRNRDQLSGLRALGLFKDPVPTLEPIVSPHDLTQPLEDRARSYLALNCSTCHRPQGGGTADFDFDLARSLSANRYLDASPAQGTFDVPSAKVVASGDPTRSILLLRMLKAGRGHMPQFGSTEIDRAGVKLLREWIASLPPTLNSPNAEPQFTAAALSAEIARGESLSSVLTSVESAIALCLACTLDELDVELKEQVVEAGAVHPSALVRELFEPLLPLERRTKRLGTNLDEAALLAIEGKSERGKVLFEQAPDVNCRQCHRIGEVGTAIGPDLSGIGTQQTPTEILASLVRPSEKIDARYRGRMLLTHDGQVVSGIVLEENSDSITLADSTGKSHTLRQADIDAVQPALKSVMPEMLLAGMTATQAADLLAYLSAQRAIGPLQHKHSTIPKTRETIVIDGVREAAWQAAPSVSDFVFTWWNEGDGERQQTEVRMLWDDDHLYVCFDCDDKNVLASRTERDSDVYRDDCVEVFASPEIDHPENYFNLEMNALGTQLDNYRPAGREPQEAWDPDGIRVAVHIDGTLNDPSDVDRGWTLEVAIPFRLFAHCLPAAHPRHGDRWRLNLNRLEDNMAIKSQWSQGDRNIPRFHTPDFFGFVEFVDYATINPVQEAGPPQLLKSGFTFTEGPVWIAAQQALLFSDVREAITWRYQAPDRFDQYIRDNGGGNGLAITPGHELIMCQVEARRIARLELPKSYASAPPPLEAVVDSFDGSSLDLSSGRFNQTNDVIVRSDGTIYFTDPAFRPHARELDYTGVYRIAPQGRVTLVTRDYHPNGIALSPDEKWLYVVDGNRVQRLALAEDGSASNATTLLETKSNGDGMAVDDAGNLYIATKQIEVFSADGQPFGTIRLPGSGLTNCTFGGADRKTLFATTADSLTAIAMPIPGLP